MSKMFYFPLPHKISQEITMSGVPCGRQWKPDYIDLPRYMRRRAIPRIARVEEQQRAVTTAEQALLLWYPAHLQYLWLFSIATTSPTMTMLAYKALIEMRTIEAACLYDYLSTHIPRPLTRHQHHSYHIDFAHWNTYHAFALMFRVPTFAHLETLCTLLRLPHQVRAQWTNPDGVMVDTYVATAVDTLAVCLARLAYPGRLVDLIARLQLNWSISKASSIIKAGVLHMYRTFRNRILFDERFFMSDARLREFANAIGAAGGPFYDCVGFIDGTTCHISRPGGDNMQQAAFYSGHKRYHCIRWQGVVTPDGMLASFYGPHPGASNDRGLLNVSKLDDKLSLMFGPSPNNALVSKYFLYGDLGYQGPSFTIYSAGDIDPAAVAAANSVRVSVENVFGAEKGMWEIRLVGRFFPTIHVLAVL